MGSVNKKGTGGRQSKVEMQRRELPYRNRLLLKTSLYKRRGGGETGGGDVDVTFQEGRKHRD